VSTPASDGSSLIVKESTAKDARAVARAVPWVEFSAATLQNKSRTLAPHA
jgi:hypothetical protein